MKKIKSIFKDDFIFFVLLFLISSTLSFYLGRLSVEYKQNKESQNITFLEKKEKYQQETYVVASKKGKTYSFPWCSGAKRISQKNKIIFKSKKEAEEKGYREAKNCAGF